jgi:ribosomal protein S18 acetylase RimI-like enzyme
MAEAVIVPLYVVCNTDILGDPFYSPDRFRDRLAGYTRSPGFELVVARLNDDPVGQIFGYSLPPDAGWWRGLTTPVPGGFTDEDGTRTFAVNEIMVHPGHRRRGVARALHDALLSARPERRATLLVAPDNAAAWSAYESWGWYEVGRLHPFPDAPHYHAMVIDLPLGASPIDTDSSGGG